MLMKCLAEKTGADLDPNKDLEGDSSKNFHHPPARVRYLSEIAENNRSYDRQMMKQAEVQKNYTITKILLLNLKVLQGMKLKQRQRSSYRIRS